MPVATTRDKNEPVGASAACLLLIDYSLAVYCATQSFGCEFTLLFAGCVERLVLVYLSSYIYVGT
jgi:hypothetical protein